VAPENRFRGQRTKHYLEDDQGPLRALEQTRRARFDPCVSLPGIPLRVFCPYQGMELYLFPKNHLETYIDFVWTNYAKKKSSGHGWGARLHGLVHNDGPNKGSSLMSFSRNRLRQTRLKIARDLGAGFLRSTLGQRVVNGINLDRLPLCERDRTVLYA
jgi:hypothetical protein